MACTFATLIPLWVGIVFNLAMTLFNVIGTSMGLRGRFIDWYIDDGGGWKIMASVWVILIAWSIYNNMTCH